MSILYRGKKLLSSVSVILVLVMLLSMASPLTAFAAGDGITEITRYISVDGGWEPFEQYVFEYNDTEISPSRYAAMINYFIADHGGNYYYYYNWY